MTKRRAITDAMKLASLFLRGQVICVECGGVIEAASLAQWDHRHALCLGGGHTAENVGPVHYDPCHKDKSARDERDFHHIDRLAKERDGRPKRARRSRPLRSRGFDPTKTKGFDGSVRPRKERRPPGDDATADNF